jgi:hypothetical protein
MKQLVELGVFEKEGLAFDHLGEDGEGGAGRYSRRWLRTAVSVHIWLDHEGKKTKLKCPNSLMDWLLSSLFYLVFLADMTKFDWRL